MNAPIYKVKKIAVLDVGFTFICFPPDSAVC